MNCSLELSNRVRMRFAVVYVSQVEYIKISPRGSPWSVFEVIVLVRLFSISFG
jgi:hypothetical protein